MFSRSIRRSQQQIDNEIAIRARPTEETVRRSPACSGEHNYEYKPVNFRTFKRGSDDNYVQNLLADFSNVYEKGITTLPYHHALTALHHASASRAVDNFFGQLSIVERLITMHNSPPAPPAPVPVPEPEPTCFAKARKQLAKMKFDLPPPHPKRLVVFRSAQGYYMESINPDFDPEQFASSARNTFVKTCCRRYNSVQECRCFKYKSRTSVNYVNEQGEAIHVYYLERKTDYQNLTRSYPQYYRPDEEHIPHSPRKDVSDSDMYPFDKDYDFEDERGNAYRAAKDGFTHVWSSKRAQKRHLRRQHRQKQLASGELPEFGLIIVTFDIDEVSRVKDEVHAQLRKEHKQEYEDLQQNVRFYESWEEEHQRRPDPAPVAAPAAPAAPAHPALPKQFSTKGLDHSQMRRLIQHEKKNDSLVLVHIQRPLSCESICVAHGVSRMQVTNFNVLKQYQRNRLTAMASLSALVAILLGAERGHTSAVATILHHRAIQFILRRATGSHAAADQIAAPYLKYTTSASKPVQHSEKTRINILKEDMRVRFDIHSPKPRPPSAGYRFATFPSSIYGPIEFMKAKYYAAKCLELIGNDNDPAAAARWAELSVKVQRVHKGEMSIHDVFTSHDHNNWVYAIHYTYVRAVREFLDSADRWVNEPDHAARISPDRVYSAHVPAICWRDSREIRVDAPRYVQTTLMVREMYRFIVKTQRIITPEFMNVFGLNRRYVSTMITRTKYLAHHDGDEASALMFGFFMPSLMTPDIHLDICVSGHVFQHPDLYVKMSDPVFGSIKKQFKDMIPSRHTGTIDRKTLMDECPMRCRA
jgi:hypothetical protein